MSSLGKRWKVSDEGKKRMSDAQKKIGNKPPSFLGEKHSEETRLKISEARKGKGRPQSAKSKDKIRVKMLGRNKGIENPFYGKLHTPEVKEKIGLSQKGERHHNWQGGITPINMAIRQSREYKLWRIAVFERDGYKCIFCTEGGYLEADHIKPFCLYPELRFAIDNGRTLCRGCHLKLGWRGKANGKTIS